MKNIRQCSLAIIVVALVGSLSAFSYGASVKEKDLGSQAAKPLSEDALDTGNSEPVKAISSNNSETEEAKEGFKEGGKGIGQGFVSGAKVTGNAFKKFGIMTGNAFKTAGRSIKNFFTGNRGDHKVEEKNLGSMKEAEKPASQPINLDQVGD